LPGTKNEYVTDEYDDIVVENPSETLANFSYMLDDDCFGSAPYVPEDVSYYYNHSCEPNTVYQGEEKIVALVDIGENVQVVYDYAFTETQDSFHAGIHCKCGSPKCRGVLDFLQYRDPAFIEQHYEHCTDFIKRKMLETGWCHPSVVKRTHIKESGYGLVAKDLIPRMTTILIFGGKVVTGDEVVKLSERTQIMSLQIDRNLWQIPNAGKEETGDFLNHSCAPNCGMLDSCIVRSMRDIQAGESLTIDYAMVTPGDVDLVGDSFECACGSVECRKVITNQDYKLVASKHWEFMSPVVRNKYLEQEGPSILKRSNSGSATAETSIGSSECIFTMDPALTLA
jgi:hypothetical protein